jgi:sugar/nucleoside kinase (ribokinase family)
LNAKTIDCTVIGDAVIDIFLPLSGTDDIDCLAKGGVANTKVKMSPGGTANVAFYVSALGGKTFFIGKVGNDLYGKLFIDDLKTAKVKSGVAISKNSTTGMVFVLVFPNGERAFITDRGANTELNYGDINLEIIRHSKYLYLTGFSLQDKETLGMMHKVLANVAKKVIVVFNPGTPNLATTLRNVFLDIIKEYVSIVILNEAEAKNLTQCNTDDKVIKFLTSITERVVITKGNQGSIVATPSETYHIDCRPVPAIDTTGAGDSYAASFIYCLSRGWGDEKAARFASRLAEKVVSCLGARVDVSSLLDETSTFTG